MSSDDALPEPVRYSAGEPAMRTYHSRGFRALAGGSIEVEGRWSGVSWVALGLLALLPLVMRSPLLLGAVGAAAVYLFVFPTRRRVIFDARRACLRVEHAGLLHEHGTREIPFAELRAVIFEDAGRSGGRAQRAVYARTARGRVYLVTHAGARDAEALAERIDALVDGAVV